MERGEILERPDELEGDYRPHWPMRLSDTLARISRPPRRRLTPDRFKETYVNRALAQREHPTTYVEIGVRDGESFRLANADRKIGIDPERHSNMTSPRSGELFFETTSDEFFEKRAQETLEARSVDVALIDGLHEFRQTLRDLMHIEIYMRRDGVIILDDCNPGTAKRGSDVRTGSAWNGDVWKLPAYLIAERPDLAVATIDADAGVGVVTGFGGPARPLDEALIERYKALPYDHLAANRTAVLNLLPPSRFDSLLP